MQSERERAKRLLVHYFRAIWPREKYNWDNDNVVEIEEIVDLLIDAAIHECRDIRYEVKRD